jgi:hypothetical protein
MDPDNSITTENSLPIQPQNYFPSIIFPFLKFLFTGFDEESKNFKKDSWKSGDQNFT